VTLSLLSPRDKRSGSGTHSSSAALCVQMHVVYMQLGTVNGYYR